MREADIEGDCGLPALRPQVLRGVPRRGEVTEESDGMITEREIKVRLLAVLERRDQSEARERMAKWGIELIVPEVLQIVTEEVKTAKRENIQVRRDGDERF